MFKTQERKQLSRILSFINFSTAFRPIPLSQEKQTSVSVCLGVLSRRGEAPGTQAHLPGTPSCKSKLCPCCHPPPTSPLGVWGLPFSILPAVRREIGEPWARLGRCRERCQASGSACPSLPRNHPLSLPPPQPWYLKETQSKVMLAWVSDWARSSGQPGWVQTDTHPAQAPFSGGKLLVGVFRGSGGWVASPPAPARLQPRAPASCCQPRARPAPRVPIARGWAHHGARGEVQQAQTPRFPAQGLASSPP